MAEVQFVVRGWFSDRWYWLIAWVARWIGFGLLGGAQVRGLENVPKTGPVLITPVHISHFDPPLVGCACPRRLKFMAKEELFRVPFLSQLIRTLGAFPVKRGEGDTAAIRKTIEWLMAGEAVLVFPEGHRGDAVTMGSIQSGISVLAKRTKAVVVPTGISGTEKIHRKGQKGVHRARPTLVFGKPITYEEVIQRLNGENEKQAFADFLAERIAEECRAAGLEIRTCVSKQDRKTSHPTQTQT